MLPSQCWIWACISVFAALVYPFCKRVSNYPQMLLGLGFGVVIFMTSAMLKPGAEPPATVRCRETLLRALSLVSPKPGATPLAHSY
ncbi:hypothetical protein BDW69DRAFT_168292 [Aspergillus filifer]